jgi:hypothetical protein
MLTEIYFGDISWVKARYKVLIQSHTQPHTTYKQSKLASTGTYTIKQYTAGYT